MFLYYFMIINRVLSFLPHLGYLLLVPGNMISFGCSCYMLPSCWTYSPPNGSCWVPRICCAKYKLMLCANRYGFVLFPILVSFVLFLFVNHLLGWSLERNVDQKQQEKTPSSCPWSLGEYSSHAIKFVSVVGFWFLSFFFLKLLVLPVVVLRDVPYWLGHLNTWSPVGGTVGVVRWLVLCQFDISWSPLSDGNLNWENTSIRSGCT